MAEQKKTISSEITQGTETTPPAVMAFHEAINLNQLCSERKSIILETVADTINKLKDALKAKNFKKVNTYINNLNKTPYGILGYLLLQERTEVSPIFQLIQDSYKHYKGDEGNKREQLLNLFFGPKKDRHKLISYSSAFGNKSTIALWFRTVKSLFDQSEAFNHVFSHGKTTPFETFKSQFLLALIFDGSESYSDHINTLMKGHGDTAAKVLLDNVNGFTPLDYLIATNQPEKKKTYLKQLTLLELNGFIKKGTVANLQEKARRQISSPDSSPSHSSTSITTTWDSKTATPRENLAIKAFHQAINYDKFTSEQKTLLPKVQETLKEIKTILESKDSKKIKKFTEKINKGKCGLLGIFLLSNNTDELSKIFKLMEELHKEKTGHEKEELIDLFFGPEKDRSDIIFYAAISKKTPTFSLWCRIIQRLFTGTKPYNHVFSYGQAEPPGVFKNQFLLALMFEDDEGFEKRLKDFIEINENIAATTILGRVNGIHPLEYLLATEQSEKTKIYFELLDSFAAHGLITQNTVQELKDSLDAQKQQASSSTSTTHWHDLPTSFPEEKNSNRILFDYFKKNISSNTADIPEEKQKNISSIPNTENIDLSKQLIPALSEGLSSKDFNDIKQCLILISFFHTQHNITQEACRKLLNQKISGMPLFNFLISDHSSLETTLPIYLNVYKEILGEQALALQINDFLKASAGKENSVKNLSEILSVKNNSKVLTTIKGLKLQEFILKANSDLDVPSYFDQLRETKLTDQEYNQLLLGDAEKMPQLLIYALQHAHPKTLELWFDALFKATSKNPIIGENTKKLLLSSPLKNGCKNTRGTISCYLRALERARREGLLDGDEYEIALKAVHLSDQASRTDDRETLQSALESIKKTESSEEQTAETTTTSSTPPVEQKREVSSPQITPALSHLLDDDPENWVMVGTSGKPTEPTTRKGSSTIAVLKQLTPKATPVEEKKSVQPTSPKTAPHKEKKREQPKLKMASPKVQQPINPLDFPPLEKPQEIKKEIVEPPVAIPKSPTSPKKEADIVSSTEPKKLDISPSVEKPVKEATPSEKPVEKPSVEAKKETPCEILILQSNVRKNSKKNSDFWEGQFEMLKDLSLSTFKTYFTGNSFNGGVTLLGYMLRHGAEGGVEAWLQYCETWIKDGWITNEAYREILKHPSTLDCLAGNSNKEDKGVTLFYKKFEEEFGVQAKNQLVEQVLKKTAEIEQTKSKPSESSSSPNIKGAFFQPSQVPAIAVVPPMPSVTPQQQETATL